jgi:DNA ligase 1
MNLELENFRPTLAASLDDGDPSKLQFPMVASPKIDGIRVVCHPTFGPVTRSLKPVSNGYVRRRLSDPELQGLDGEITVGPNCGPNVFADTTGAIRASGGSPAFTYWVFDEIRYQEPYQTRLTRMSSRLFDLLNSGEVPNVVQVLESETVYCMEDVEAYEEHCLKQGFEGIMLRSPLGKYKFGRSTFKEQILIKVKRFKDDEAIIVGFEALQRNQNEQVRNALGLAERSSHKEGRVTDNLLGTLKVTHPAFGEFGIGSGFDISLREQIWSNQDHYLGKQVTFKYQPIGTVDKPRFPIFMRFREE